MTPEICLSSSSLQLLLNLASVSTALLHVFNELPRYVQSLQVHTSPANSLYVSMPALLPIVALLAAFPVGAAPGVRRVLPYTTLVMKGILSAQCFYRMPREGVSSAGEEEAVWAAVQDRYEKALGQLNPVVKDDLDRYLMERLLVTLTRVRQRRWGEA